MATDSKKSNQYVYKYEAFKFDRNIKTNKGAIVYDPRTSSVVRKFTDIFVKETNVESLIFSSEYFVLDNLWNLYDLNTGQLVHKIQTTNPCVVLNNEFTKFLLNGRYFLATSQDNKKIYVVRCYDSFIVAVLRVDDCINCIRTGDSDRIIFVGTKTGHVIGAKFLIDLEFDDAIRNHIGFCRNKPAQTSTTQKELTKLSTRADKTLNLEEIVKDNLNNDLKRVIHSAHAHRQLRSKESLISASSFLCQNSSSSFFNNSANDFHIGIAKANLTRVTSGIKNSPISTRACIIQ